MATALRENPISDLTYDWLTVLHAKAEGVNAYEKYIQDAEKQKATRCVELLRKLHDEDARQLEEIRDHVKMMLDKQ